MAENVIGGPYEVIVSDDGETLPLMWEVEPPLEMSAHRMFKMKEEDAMRAINAFLVYHYRDRSFGGFDPKNHVDASIRVSMKRHCIWDCKTGEVFVDDKVAHAITLGKYGF